jgi:hypothetical protein
MAVPGSSRWAFRIVSNFDQFFVGSQYASLNVIGCEESVMSLLMIRCPLTGQEVWTGIKTDPDSFRKIPDDLFYTSCPRGGLDHSSRLRSG